jgi:NADH:ubiquinone oxidoreductase subunit 6 (subunit J)
MRLLEYLKNFVVFVVVDIWSITLITLLGVVALYLLLPQPRRRPVLFGVGAAVLALLLTGWFIVRVGEWSLETVLFYLFAAIAIGAGGLLVTQRNPARAALSFAIVVLATCGLFLLQAAPFLMAATIIVYAGAIIVTFLFVLMLAQQQGLSDADARSREPLFATITGFLLLATLLYVLRITYKPNLDEWVRRSEDYLTRVESMREREDGLKEKVREAQDKVRKAKDANDRKQREEELKRLENEQKGEKRKLEDEKKVFEADLNSFLVDYGRWWRNDATNYPSGGQRLAAAIKDARFYALPPIAGSEEDGTRELAELPIVEGWLARLYDAGVETRNSPLLGNSQPTSTA